MKTYKNSKLRKILKGYYQSIEKLRNNKFIKTYKVVGGIGEFFASKICNLTLQSNSSAKGFDAIDKMRKKVQIKTRHSHKFNPRVTTFRPFSKLNKQLFDYALLVILDEEYWVKEIWKVPYKIIKNNVDNKNKVFSFSDKMKKLKDIKLLYPNK